MAVEKLKVKFRDRDLFVRLFGENVYAVGGYVRDLVMGTLSEEVDILIIRTPLEEIVPTIRKHGKVDLVGKSFGIIKFTKDGKTYDIALPRKDVPKEKPARRHKDFLISADPDLPLERDLERRDFRCNSMAVRLKDGALVDPFDGVERPRKTRLPLQQHGREAEGRRSRRSFRWGKGHKGQDHTVD